jgi:type VI secretion system secreted protein Hcp
VPGESKNPRHFGEIEIFSFSFGNEARHIVGAGGGGGAGRLSLNDLTIFKTPDRASAILTLACHRGEHIREGVLTMEKLSEAGGVLRSVIYKMESILVSRASKLEDLDEFAFDFETGKLL